MPIVRQVGLIDTPAVLIGMPKWITSPLSRTTAEVERMLPAGAPLKKGFLAFTRKPPSAGTASPELSSQSPPPVVRISTFSCATFSRSGVTGAFWCLKRHAFTATWCVCIEKASAVLEQARAIVRSMSQELVELEAFAAQLARHAGRVQAALLQLAVV